MENESGSILVDDINKHKYTKVEKDAAIDFAKFIYDLWVDHIKNGIIKADKMQNNEEPTNIN